MWKLFHLICMDRQIKTSSGLGLGSRRELQIFNYHVTCPCPYEILWFYDGKSLFRTVTYLMESHVLLVHRTHQNDVTIIINLLFWAKSQRRVALWSLTMIVEFLIDNIFVKFGGHLFCQVIGILMGTNCAPLLADLFLYSYESDFLDNMIRPQEACQII